MQIAKYGRYWGVWDADGGLVCVTVYRKGAREVVKRLTAHPHAHQCHSCHASAVCTMATCTPMTPWLCQDCTRWFRTPAASQARQQG